MPQTSDTFAPTGGVPPRRPQKLRDAWEQQVRADARVVGSSLLVLLTLASHGDRDGSRLAVAVATLAAETGLHERTVREGLKLGQRLGYLARLRRGHRAGDGRALVSEYQLARPQPGDTFTLSAVSTGPEPPLESHLNRVRPQPQPGLAHSSQPGLMCPLPGSDQVETTRSGGEESRHKHEPNARRALETLGRERRLGIGVDELLAIAYAVDADPWNGYKAIKRATERWDGVVAPRAALRHRLGLERPEVRAV